MSGSGVAAVAGGGAVVDRSYTCRRWRRGVCWEIDADSDAGSLTEGVGEVESLCD